MKRYGRQVSLSGSWKFRTDPDGMGDRYPDDAVAAYKEDCQFFDPGYDDRDWGEIAVPACWQAEGHDYNGAAWYRLRFDHRPGAGENVARLSFLGVDYFADVWLNGYFLGSHEGFFNHFEFDASRWIRAGENLLVVKVDSPNLTNLKVRPIDKTIVKGALDDWDCNDLTVNPGGIFADVRLLLSSDVYLGRVKATPLVDVAEGSARVMCRVEAVNTTGRFLTVGLAAALEPTNFTGRATRVERELVLPPGPSELDLWIDVAEPRLWWPWDLGEQHLYSLDLSVREGERTLDRLSDRIGLRQVRTEPGSSAIHVNGTRVFCRGPNYVSEQLQSNMTNDKYRTDVRLMREANMNMVRVYCVVEKEEFYDACDEHGILVYQDFPMQGRMSNSSDLVRRSVPQARDMVNQLYNHPSIVLWCFGAQPGLRNFEKVGMAMAAAARRDDPYRFVQQGASVWEWKLIKDKYDWPIDYHFFCGWFSPEFKHAPFHPREVLELPPEECASGASVEELKIKRKELLEFVSEYGTADSLPELDSLRKFIAEEDLWPVNWKIFTRRGLHSDRLRKWTGTPASLEQMIAASQDYQAFVLKYHTEFFRRHKFAPCNGALFFQFRDCWPAVTASVVDYYGKKKKGYFALQQAFNPLHVMMDWPDLAGEPAGSTFRRAIYVVNDYAAAYPSLTVTWQVLGAGDAVLATGTITCAAPANSLQQVGEVTWDTPAAGGSYRVSLTLERDAEPLSRNQYTVQVHASAAAGGAEGLRGRGSRYRRRTGSAVEALVQERTTEDDTP